MKKSSKQNKSTKRNISTIYFNIKAMKNTPTTIAITIENFELVLGLKMFSRRERSK